MKLYKCVYCLEEKTESEFNIEHVVPQLMGTYENSFTLHKNEVCKDCNTSFSVNLESKLALDSFEALLRMTKGNKRIKDGNTLGKERIKVSGDEGIFKNLNMTVKRDNSNQEKIKAVMEPSIGLIIPGTENEYEYFHPEKLPYYSEVIEKRLINNENPIIFWEIDDSEIEIIMKSKGYDKFKKESFEITDLHKKNTILTKNKVKVTSMTRRLIAKTVFNYLTYHHGKEIMLGGKFDILRNYIRYGITNDKLNFIFINGKVTNFKNDENSHVVGAMWENESFMVMRGVLSWFSEFTCHFWITDNTAILKCDLKLPISIFNNETRKITEHKNIYCM